MAILRRRGRDSSERTTPAQQSAPAPAPFEVRVSRDGTCTVGGASVVPAEGQPVHEAALNHLHRLAMATGHSVRATVTDERGGHVTPIEVRVDGSSHFAGEPSRIPEPAGAQPTGQEAPGEPETGTAQAPVAGAGYEPGAQPGSAAGYGSGADPVPAAASGSGQGSASASGTGPGSGPVADRETGTADRETGTATPGSDLGPGTAQAPGGGAGAAPAAPAPRSDSASGAGGVPAPRPDGPLGAAPEAVPDTAASQGARTGAGPDPAAAPDTQQAPDPAARPGRTPRPTGPGPASAQDSGTDSGAGTGPSPDADTGSDADTGRDAGSGSGSAPAGSPHAAPAGSSPAGAAGAAPVAPAAAEPRPEDAEPTPPPGQDSAPHAVPTIPAYLSEAVRRINEAIRLGNITSAAAMAQQSTASAVEAFGEEHPHVLNLRELCAYVAYLAGDPARSIAISLDTARARQRQGDPRAYQSVLQAAAAWRTEPDPHAGLRLGRELLELWSELASAAGPAASDIAQLEAARRRMDRLAERARGTAPTGR